MPRSRAIALLATGLAGAAGLAGCGGGGSPARLDASALKQTAQTTEAAGSARMEFSARLTVVLQAGQSTVPVEAWLDGHKRLRRESATLANLGTMRLDLYDFGEQRRVVAPPADEVANLGQ